MKITVFDRAVSTYKPLLKWTTTAPPSEKSMLRHCRSFQVVFKSFAAGFRSFQLVSGRFRSFQLVLTFINYEYLSPVCRKECSPKFVNKPM